MFDKLFKVSLNVPVTVEFYKSGDDVNVAEEQVQEYLAALRRVVNIPEEYEGDLFVENSLATVGDPEVFIAEVEE